MRTSPPDAPARASSSLGAITHGGGPAAILQHLPAGVVVTNAESRILWANEAYCSLTGHAMGELVGETPRLFRDAPVDGRIRELWEALSAGGTAEARVHDRRPDGTTYVGHLAIARVIAGEEVIFVGLMRDATSDAQLEEQLGELMKRAAAGREMTLVALASLAEQRDEDTGGHLARVEAYCRAMARWLIDHAPSSLPPWARDAATIARCATLHDIGKVGIPDAVLRKPGALSPEERAVMREHSRIGADIISRVLAVEPTSEFLRIAHDITLCHHEAYDGSGYPRGLRGEAIPMVAQLATLADVLDALTSRRPYKPPYSFAAAREWVASRRGSLFNLVAVDAFLAVQDELRDICETHREEPASEQQILPSGMRSEPAPAPAVPAFHDAEDLAPPDERVVQALERAVEHPVGGHVVLRHGEDSSQISIRGGRVVWIHAPSLGVPLQDVLREAYDVPAEALDAAIAACRETGRAFVDMLLEQRALGRDVLEGAVREHLADRLAKLLHLRSPGVSFVPDAHVSASALAFELGDLLPAESSK